MTEFRSYKRVAAPEIETRAGAPVLTGYAAVFGQYSQNLGGFVEMIDPSAFDEALGRSLVVALVNHDPNLLLGSTMSHTLRLSRDTIGLRYEVDLDVDDPDAVSAIAKVRAGKMPGSSFSFRTTVDGDAWSTTEQGFPLRTIRKVDELYDVGPVTFPAYRGTQAADAQTALRSLSLVTGVDVSELVAAAGRDELRSLLPAAQPTSNVGAHPVSNTGPAEFRARQLALLARR
jgi:uncharacterized protein